MLSPGKHHLLIEKDPVKNLQQRLGILREALESPVVRQGLLLMCKEDVLFFIDLFGIQINPSTRARGPFITWPYQEAAIAGGETEIGGVTTFQHGLISCIEEGEDVRWPKSREGGASWCVLFVFVWLGIFHENIALGALSRDMDSVDKIDDPNSLFEKVRVMLRYLPDWMKGDVKDKKASFTFANGNTLTGEANVSSANVGGRLTALLIDEFGQFDRNGEAIFSFTSDVTKCRIFVYTHKDQMGMAYQLSSNPKYATMREIMTHWSQHPDKNKGLYRSIPEENKVEILDKQFPFPPKYQFDTTGKPLGGPCPGIRSPWYDKECIRRTDRDVQMNLDIDPSGGTTQFFNALMVSELARHYACAPCWEGEFIEGKLIAQPEGKIKLWRLPRADGKLVGRFGAAADLSMGVGASPSCLSIGDADTGEKILEYQNADQTPDEFAAFCLALLPLFPDAAGEPPLLSFERRGPGMIFLKHMLAGGYRRFHYEITETRLFGKVTEAPEAGWKPNLDSKKLLLSEYQISLKNRTYLNRSLRALQELLVWKYDQQGYVVYGRVTKNMDGSGARDNHGDQTIADALADKMMKQLGVSEVKKEEEDPYRSPASLGWRKRHAERQAQQQESWVT
jgi:hypothetical protein